MAESKQIGVTFLPSQENQMDGPRRGGLEGDLGAAFKILSLRMPRQPSIRGITTAGLLTSPGASGMSGTNPQAAIFEQLIRAMLGQGAAPAGAPMMGGAGTPRIIPGDTGTRMPGPGTPTFPGVPAGSPTYDRTNPGVGNRDGGPPLNDYTAPQAPMLPRRRGPFGRDTFID